MYASQQVLVSQNIELIAILTFLCQQSHKLTNREYIMVSNYFFKSHKTIGKFDAWKSLQTQIWL